MAYSGQDIGLLLCPGSSVGGSIAPDAARLWVQSMEKEISISRGISTLFRGEREGTT